MTQMLTSIIFLFFAFATVGTGGGKALFSPGQNKLIVDHSTQDSTQVERIAAAARAFSTAYMDENTEAMMHYYTKDAAIFPTRGDILDTPEAIAKYWTVPEGVDILHHKSTSEEIKIAGDTAYDYGYYEGRIERNGEKSEFEGKYVIVWEKGADGQWRMKLDIWNRR